MDSLKEYSLQKSMVSEWLPWGGLTKDCVMEQKDGAFFGVIEYQTYPTESPAIDLIFPRGWSLWLEDQGMLGETRSFIVVCWNPFIKNGMAVNTLSQSIKQENCLDYFEKALHSIAVKLQTVTTARCLVYQDFLDVLSFSLSLGLHKIEMPTIPLYLDALLSQDLTITFGSNQLTIDDNEVVVVSLLGMPSMHRLLPLFQGQIFRHVRRLLCFNKKQATRDLAQYTSRWCSSRSYVKKRLLQTTLSGTLHGYFTEAFILLFPSRKKEAAMKKLITAFNQQEILYRIEDFNLKDKWWSFLPGLFRADIEPPLVSFSSLGEVLLHSDEPLPKNALDVAAEELITHITMKKGESYVPTESF